MKEKVVTKKVVKQYTFRQRKCECGSNEISNVSFDSPDADGITIQKMLKGLSEGHIITVTVEVLE